jgi:glycosyltransferase involved in cell wall biosynthesis
VIAVMIHEPYVPMISWRWTILGLWQRIQLAAIRLSSDLVFTSIDPWAKKFAAQRPSRPAHHLPVGSNFPYAGSRSEGNGAQEGAGKPPVVATLARDHRSWLGEYVINAMNEIAASGCTARLLVLGAEAPEMASLHPAVDVEAPGYLEPREFTELLTKADLFLIPLEDGISTRRSALMVALQHGLPIVGTAGALTDPILLEADSALRLVPVGDVDGFADEALSLASDPAARALAGRSARRLYEKNFDWDVVVDKMLDALPSG